MKKAEFDSLDTKDLKEGFLKCGDSAFMHFGAAEILAKNGYYQLGCAHLILGAEETLKSISFFTRLRSFGNVRFDPKFFYDHPSKHHAINKAFWEWHDNLKEMFTIFHRQKNASGLMKVKNMRLLQEYLKIDRKSADLWWKSANNLKNRAFYVGKPNTNWESPDAITKVDYDRGEKVIRGLKAFLQISHRIESESNF